MNQAVPKPVLFLRAAKMCALPLLFVVATAGAAFAQFGFAAPTEFTDSSGAFSLQVPVGWTYQAESSEPGFALFYGPGEHDLFYVEIVGGAAGASSAEAEARSALERYATGELNEFRVISPPARGTLSGREASFIVYSYTDSSGTAMTEGRGFVVADSDVYTIAFADASDRFDGGVDVFNSVLQSFRLGPATHAAPSFGAASGGGNASGAPAYTGPGAYYSLTVPAGWEVWEEQATARGDAVEPWHSLLEWPGKPLAKTLFIWDFFDEWLQTGAQYEIVAAVIDELPGTQADAVEQLAAVVAGDKAATYEAVTRRVRLGGEAAFAVKMALRPGRTELWSEAPPWHRDFTFFMLKRGTAMFVLAVPDAIVDGPELTGVLESFTWHAR